MDDTPSPEGQLVPQAFTVTRYRCPLCRWARSTRSVVAEHIGRCWYNPAARSCKTCDHYLPGESDAEGGYYWPELCAAGVDLNEGLPVGCPSWAPKDGAT